jgi:hypothetical protein
MLLVRRFDRIVKIFTILEQGDKLLIGSDASRIAIELITGSSYELLPCTTPGG